MHLFVLHQQITNTRFTLPISLGAEMLAETKFSINCFHEVHIWTNGHVPISKWVFL